jgi:hypothetical protein
LLPRSIRGEVFFFVVFFVVAIQQGLQGGEPVFLRARIAAGRRSETESLGQGVELLECREVEEGRRAALGSAALRISDDGVLSHHLLLQPGKEHG